MNRGDDMLQVVHTSCPGKGLTISFNNRVNVNSLEETIVRMIFFTNEKKVLLTIL
jgi:hypothetical protein